MNFNLDLGQWIIIGLSAFLLIWYFAANSYNRKRGTATFRWLYRALETLGEISKAEWIGAANMGARLSVKKAAKPFRSVEAHCLLEPREFLPYWLVSRFRGKREQVLIKMVLRTGPKGRLEIERKAGKRMSPTDDRTLTHLDFHFVSSGFSDDQFLGRVNEFLAKNGNTIKRICIQPDKPHLEIEVRINQLLDSPADTYFESLLVQSHDS